MTRAIQLSRTIYRAVMFLYPTEFRCDFGEEMLETFAEDLAAQQAGHGFRGVLTVWRTALSEVIRLTPRLWVRNATAVAPPLTALAMIATASPALVHAIQRQAHAKLRPGETTPLDLLLALALEGTIAALTAFVAVQRSNNERFIGLGDLRRGE
jgi:hypothetical protein